MNTILVPVLVFAGLLLMFCLYVLYRYMEKNEQRTAELERTSQDHALEIERLKAAQNARMNHKALEHVENAQARVDSIRDDANLLLDYVRSALAGISKEADNVIEDLAKAHTPTKK